MLNKIYERVLKYIKEEYKFLIIMLTIFVTMTYKLPYYIDAPGGIIDISKRIEIDEKNNLEGTMNFAYVSEMRATIPTYIIAKINKNWDIIKKEEVVLENETESDARFRDNLSLKEALSNALYVGFTESKEEFKTKNNKVYVTQILKGAKTDLKIGDQILEADGIKINNIKELQQIEKQEGKKITLKVINKNKEYTRTAEYIKYEDKIIIGIALGETFEIDTNHKIDIDYKARESGPSGGMMMALTTYSYLTGEDLTKGRTVVGTGTIDAYGNVGSIGGVKYKLIGAVKKKADIFLVPNGENYEEALKVKKEKNYDIKIVGISNIKEAINELKK